MSSTYLSLTNQVLRQLRQTELTSSNFATAVNIQEAAKDAVNYSLAYIDTQEFEWPFNFDSTGSQTLTVGEVLYSFPSNYKRADWESFYIYNDGTVSDSTYHLRRMNEEEWHRYAKDADYDNTTSGRDRPFRVFPYGNQQFGLTPVTNAAYVVKYNYWKKFTALSAHDDATVIPPQFDFIIVLGAMWHLGLFRSDQGAADRYEGRFMKSIAKMRGLLINQDEDVTSSMVNSGKVHFRESVEISS